MLDSIDKEEKWNPQHINPESFNEDKEVSQRYMINLFVITLASIFVGIYSGLRSRDGFEILVYCGMFLLEAGGCEALVKCVSDSYKPDIRKFSLQFLICASSSLCCSLLKKLFKKNY